MRSSEELATAVVQSLQKRSFAKEVHISELNIPGEFEMHLRVSAFEVSEDSLDRVEPELYDLLYELEDLGYPARGLVSVYRPAESEFARHLPPAPIQRYRPGTVEALSSGIKNRSASPSGAM